MNAETPVGGRSARATFGLHLALGIGAFVMLAPLAWMLLTSLKSFPEVIAADGRWLPADPQWGNYATVMGDFAYHRFFVNSLFVTGMVVAGTLLTCCPAAYAFAFYDLPYRNLLFSLLLATMMLPGQVTVIPIFSTFVKLGWINTYLPMIVPAWLGSNVFGIFLLRQHFRTIPPSYIEAARVDGASEWKILWTLIVPMSLPVVLTVGIFTFLWSWNDLFNPLIYLHNEEMYTLPVGMLYFIANANKVLGGTADQAPWHLIMALAVVMVAPVVALFVVAQRRFVAGLASAGVKG